MLLEVLDIGSNSAGAVDPAGVDGPGRIVAAVSRAMTAAARLGVQQLYVFTTSAVRDAANRDLILNRVEAGAGVRPQYLAGVDEGRLSYVAVHQWYGWSAGRQLVLDIGGGRWRSCSAGTPAQGHE